MSNLAEFLENQLKKIADNPDEVGVEEKEGLLEIFANPADLGVIIGKSGRNIRALKTVVNLKTAKEGQPRMELKIHEENPQN